MSAPDPVTTGVVLASALQIAKQGQDFIAAITGHPGESISTIIGNWIRRRRENAKTVGYKSHLILLNIGVNPREDVPLNIIQPLLEAASLQEDPDLQDIWANLLANAADPRDLTPVGPMFADMLRNLGTREVRFLDALYADAKKKGENGFFPDVPRQRYDRENLWLLYTALGLKPHAGGKYSEQDYFWLMLDIIRREGVLHEVYMPPDKESSDLLTRIYRISDLGAAFILACRPPEATESGAE